MPSWVGMAAVLGFNYRRHRQHRSTLCSLTRRLLPWPAVASGWAALTFILLRHLRRGY